MPKYPQALFWTDWETTGLDPTKDQVLEVATIITDFDLNKISGYEEVLQLTQAGLDRIKGNEVVKAMHLKSGLVADARKSTKTVAEVEQELIALIKETTTFEKGEFMMAGSGVGAFDLPWCRHHMPELASYFAYYPFDIGVYRRVSKILVGKYITNPSNKSHGDEKVHRAMADVEAHLEEAESFREVLRASSLAR
jgi:oligoribonuclease